MCIFSKMEILHLKNLYHTVEVLVYALLTYASLVNTFDLRERFLAPGY
jgi:hypothetical protein